jgi:hypothetical protein
MVSMGGDDHPWETSKEEGKTSGSSVPALIIRRHFGIDRMTARKDVIRQKGKRSTRT